MRVIAAILAGGSGSRIGGETPKQMLLLGGKPVLEHSLATFNAHPGIDGIVIVSRVDMIPAVRALAAPYGKVCAVVPGGVDRTGSSLAALRAVEALPEDGASSGPSFGPSAGAEAFSGSQLLIHDAARPLVDAGVITRCLEALSEFSAVEPAVPLSDTIIRIDDDGLLVDVPPRSTLRAVQTPQGFRLPVLAEAFRRHLEDHSGFRVTDDISLVRHYLPDITIKVVPGSPRNLKLTHPTDLPLLEALLSTR